MNHLNTLLVATDLSWYARRAETRAAMLARELGSESLDLLHVIGNLALESLRHLATQTSQETEQRLLDSARKQMNEVARNLAEKHGIPVTTTLAIGRAHVDIVRHAESIDAGMVVLGAHGGSFLRELFLGSTAEKVLRKHSRPVLIVKREPQGPYQRVLVPVDFSEPSRLAMELALRIAPHAYITVLHAFEVPFEGKMRYAGVGEESVQSYRATAREQANQAMRQFVSASGASAGMVSAIAEFGSAPTVIRAKADALEPDLIVMGKHGQSGWEDLLLGSVTKHVILDAGCDVLVVSPSPRSPCIRAGRAK